MHSQTPFLLVWSLLFSSSPSTEQSSSLLPCFRSAGKGSLLFFSLLLSLPPTTLILSAPQMHSSSPIVFCTAERETCLQEKCEKRSSSLSVSLWELPGEGKRHLQGGASFGVPEQTFPLGVVPEDLSQKGPEFW